MKKSILFGERVEKTTNNRHGWNVLYDSTQAPPKVVEHSLSGKKSVIFFPGDGSHSAEEANGCCKTIQNMLLHAGLPKADMPHLYGLAYAGGEQDEHRHQILTELKQTSSGSDYVARTDFAEKIKYYQPFFDTYILPLLANKKGQALPLSEITQNLQNMTFASHCHGGFMAYQIEKMIADKLTEFYPREMPHLMSNIRMIHFSSRRPKGIHQWGKHFDIVSRDDSMYADEAYLEYDDIHKQIHRFPLSENSALIPLSPNEEFLVLKKLTNTFGEYADEDFEHTKILSFFAGTDTDILPQNIPLVQLTQQLLRHFVEHPDDPRSLEDQLKELNPALVNRNIKTGKKFLKQEKEAEKVRRGILSLISDWGKTFGAHLARRDKNHVIDHGKRHLDTSQNDFLEQRDDQGRFLLPELIEQYQKTGDNHSLVSFLKDISPYAVPKRERGDLILSAVQRHDWTLFKNIGGKKRNYFYVKPDQIPEIIATVNAADLHRLLPFLRCNELDIIKMPEALALLMGKIKGIKNPMHKEQLDTFFKQNLEFCFGTQKESFKTLLKQASMKDKKAIKSSLPATRGKKAQKTITAIKERDKDAPEATMKEVLSFNSTARRQWPGITLKDLRQFKEAQEKDKDLAFDQFMMNRKKEK